MQKRKRRKAGTRKQPMPGWIYLLVGLALGLAVAFGIYMTDRRQPPAPAPVAPPAEPAATKPAKPAPPKEAPPAEKEFRFDFYEMLPNLDVEVYDEPRPEAPRSTPQPPSAPGVYILQAGSFSRAEDAERRKAELGLLGVRTDIMRGSANGRTVYRVYTDTLESADELDRVTALLQGADIDYLAKRISD